MKISIAILNAILFPWFFVKTSDGQINNDKEPGWEELKSLYEFPKWYTEARFGIWLHWGAQTQPEEGGGWYARHMYMQNVGSQTFGKNAYPYHVKKYGHPSEVRYKEVLNSWKVENLNTDALMKNRPTLNGVLTVVIWGGR